MDVIIDPNDIDELLVPPELRRLPTCDHVTGFKLAAVIRSCRSDIFRGRIPREYVDHRIDMKKLDARIDLPHRFDRLDRRVYQLSFNFVAAISCERVENASVASGP